MTDIKTMIKSKRYKCPYCYSTDFKFVNGRIICKACNAIFSKKSLEVIGDLYEIKILEEIK